LRHLLPSRRFSEIASLATHVANQPSVLKKPVARSRSIGEFGD
jgi:hypothetical protein